MHRRMLYARILLDSDFQISIRTSMYNNNSVKITIAEDEQLPYLKMNYVFN